MYYASFVVRASGLNALLRVPRPLRGLLLYLRKALSPLALANIFARLDAKPQFIATVACSVRKAERQL
jgi:hypothetical protein